MNVVVTRYEEVGRVFDFGLQNAIIVAFVAVCLAGVTGAFLAWATAPRRSEVPAGAYRRARASPIAVGAIVATVFVLFFTFRVYRAPFIPAPTPTATTILAQSVRTAALWELRDVYGSNVTLDSTADMATDDARFRSATPRSHTIAFHMRINGTSAACTGIVTVKPAVASTAIAGGHRDRLNAHTGAPSDTYAPVAVTAQCT